MNRCCLQAKLIPLRPFPLTFRYHDSSIERILKFGVSMIYIHIFFVSRHNRAYFLLNTSQISKSKYIIYARLELRVPGNKKYSYTHIILK